MSSTSILVPTDFSNHSTLAYLYAASLAERFGATLHLLHVLTLHEYEGERSEEQLPDITPWLDRADAAARARLDAGVDHGGEAEVEVVRAVARAFNAYEAIVDYAEDRGIDLIVMSTRGNTGLARALLGSVTERVLRLAPCPVLVVDEADRGPVDEQSGAVDLRRVVVADDLTDKTMPALALIASQLAPYAPEVHLIHVVEVAVPDLYTMAGVKSVFELDSSLRDRLVEGLRERVVGVLPAEWAVHCEVRDGRAHEVVPGYSAEVEADLLVVAGESRIDLTERVLGGTTERIVRHAPCPSLVT